MFVEFQIDFNSDEAIYQQLCNQIIIGIAHNQLRDGDFLPSVRQMAETIGINMHTVNKAYAILRDEGFVTIDRRKGTCISVDADRRQAMNYLRRELTISAARAYCHSITREDFHSLIDEIYDQIEK